MCVFIYMTYFVHMKDTSVVMLRSKSMECMHRRVVLRYVPSSLRSSCQAASRNDSFLSSNSVYSHFSKLLHKWHVFSILSVCLFSIWTTAQFLSNPFRIHIQENGTMWEYVRYWWEYKLDISEPTHFLKVPFAAL